MDRVPLAVARNRSVALTDEISALIAANAPVAIGVSGGKDSSAVAFATIKHLDAVGHTGPRVLVHADLGVTEWVDSLPQCQRLAERLGLELIVVRRQQGDMMDRWEQRWKDNVRRWETLSCVKLILPWSTPSMRFCTSELKAAPITKELVRRFPGQTIINATGIRRQESSGRAKAPVAKPQPKLKSITHKTAGVDWHPIIDWSIEDVFSSLEEERFSLHEGYTKFGSSRISCVYCMLATEADHKAGVADERNHKLGHRMASLEVASTFAFQGNRWLYDTLASALNLDRSAVESAKNRAASREKAEAKIPKHLLYTKGWPTCVPTYDEAALLAAVRFQVADAVSLKFSFIKPTEIQERYERLLAAKPLVA